MTKNNYKDEIGIGSEYLDVEEIDTRSEFLDVMEKKWAEDDPSLKLELEKEESFESEPPDVYPFNDLARNIEILNKREYEEWKDNIEDESLEEELGEPDLNDTTFLELSNFTERAVQRLSSIAITAINYDPWRRSILRRVLLKVQSADVNLTDRDSVARFLEQFRLFNQELAVKFEKNMNVLLTYKTIDEPLDSKNTTIFYHAPASSMDIQQNDMVIDQKETNMAVPKMLLIIGAPILIILILGLLVRKYSDPPFDNGCRRTTRVQETITKLDGYTDSVDTETIWGTQCPDGSFYPDP